MIDLGTPGCLDLKMDLKRFLDLTVPVVEDHLNPGKAVMYLLEAGRAHFCKVMCDS